MMAGDLFYLQLFANTGGYAMTSFEVMVVEDSAVCQLVPTSGSFNDSFVGPVVGELSGLYWVELLMRLRNPSDLTRHFTKYSRFQKLEPLTHTHGHLGYIQMKAVGSGLCLTSAVVTTFFHSGGTASIPGVTHNGPLTLVGNTLVVNA